MATKSALGGGTAGGLLPHVTTLPLACKAALQKSPVAIATKSALGTGGACGSPFHSTTVPSDLSPRAELFAATAMKFAFGAGTLHRLHSPYSSTPHATIVPSDFRPRLKLNPAAISTKSEFGEGTSHCAKLFRPHATMVPSDVRPRL